MSKKTPKAQVPESVRILAPSEYPSGITERRGMYSPEIRFAAIHPLGLYYVEHHGAGHHAAYFLPKRKGSRPKSVGSGSSLAGALRRISKHEDDLVNPDVPREWGKEGPVSIYALGQRKPEAGKKTPTELDREIEAFLRTNAAT